MAERAGFKKFVVACALLTVLPATALANPDNDDRTKPSALYSPDSTLVGIRGVAVDSALLPVLGVPVTSPTVAADDPPLVKPPGFTGTRSTCKDRDQPDEFGRATLWYEIVASRDRDPFGENTLVSVDLATTTYRPNAIAIYEDQIPPAYDQAAPVLPTNLVACDKGSATVPAQASVIARAKHRYFLEVASLSGGGSLTVYIRTLDVQAPSIGLRVLPENGGLLPSPRTATKFALTADDIGSGVPADGITWRVEYDDKALVQQPDCAEGGVPTAVGAWCVVADAGTGGRDRPRMVVLWPGQSGQGRVIVDVRDRVGNTTSAGYLLDVHPRTPPRVTVAAVVRSTGVLVRAWCGRTSSLELEITASATGRTVRHAHIRAPARRWRGRTFRGLASGVYFVRATCTDAKRNVGVRYAGFIL